MGKADASPASMTSGRRAVATVALFSLLCGLLVIGLAVPAHAAPAISLSKTASGEVLAGEPITYTLTASNPLDNADVAPEFNATFRDVLPAGIDYVPGSTSPAEAGEPSIVTDPDTGESTLVWSNVTDLQPGDSYSITFQAQPDPDEYLVGATADNSADVYAQTDPRLVPRFNPDGTPVDGSYTESASAAASTEMSAIRVTKSEPSPEGELLRGVHDNTTVYTLTVENNTLAATDDVLLVDHIPAAIEFLGCGGVDNTTGQQPEYPGAPALTGTPVPGGCVDPVSVSTVLDPPPEGGTAFPAGVYTVPTWDLGTLAPGETVTITYAAGIPLFANTASWPDGEPTTDSLGQASNLDNNSGPSTRETGTEQSATNTARASGTYTGQVAEGTSDQVDSVDEESVTIEDVRVRKEVSPDSFTAGQIATYTLIIDASEYVSAGPVQITDTIPNGMCPLDDTQNFDPDGVAECDPAGSPPSIDPPQPGFGFASAPVNAEGGFDVSFTPITSIPANGTVTITYDVRMREDYRPGSGAGNPPTSNQDTFTNDVDIDAVTTPIPNSPETGTQDVGDSSSTTIEGSVVTLDKTILPRSESGQTCGTDGSGYGEPGDFPADETQFGKGDRLCFKIRVDFSDQAATRDPALVDFLPTGTSYEPGSMTPTTNNTVQFLEFNEAEVVAGTRPPIWVLGEEQADGNRYVDLGAVFEVTLAATVEENAAGPAPDLTGNLVKMRTEDREGRSHSYRDDVPVSIAPAPPVTIIKGVAAVDDPADGPNGPDVDGSSVREQSVATFRIDLGNDGTPENANDDPVSDLIVWDVLPEQVDCSLIQNVSDGGTCTDPGETGHPSFEDNDGFSAIAWTLPGPLAPGDTLTITYDMVIPDLTSVDERFDNTAYVRSFTAFTNGPGETVDYYPQDNVDTTIPEDEQLAPVATDPSFVQTDPVTVEKTGITSIVEQNNNEPNQAVVGEYVDYSYGVIVPSHLTVFDGVLVDDLPTGLELQDTPAPIVEFYPDAASDVAAPTPTGFDLDPATGTLTFPETWDNTTDTDQRFLVTVRVLVTPDAIPPTQPRRTVTNQTRFNSTDEVGGTPLPEQSAVYQVQLRQPDPDLTKSNDSGGPVAGSQIVEFTLDAQTDATQPPLHDTWIVDCVPAELLFLDYGPSGSATPLPAEPGDDTNGCATGTTRLAWDVGTLTPGDPVQVTYTVQVTNDAAGAETYTNVATLTGSSLDDGKDSPTAPDNPNERGYTDSDSNTLVVSTGTSSKSVDPQQATIGERVTFTAIESVQPDVNFYQAAVLDTLPRGLDPSTLQLESIECTEPDTGASCDDDIDPRTIPPQTNPDGSTTFGISFGDLFASPEPRAIQIEYSIVVDDLDGGTFPQAGTVLTNSLAAHWDVQNTDDVPDSVDYPWDQDGATQQANVTVVEPDLVLTKEVDNPTPAPGEAFQYTLTLTNQSGSTVSDAYNAVIVDDVPAGVVVTPESISHGGELTGADPVTGNGTITWDAVDLPGPLPPGESIVVDYVARLAPSETLTADPLTNTASLPSYESLPSGGRTYQGDDAEATVIPQFPALDIDKTTPDGSLTYIDDEFLWQIQVTNTGGATASDIEVSDTLPPNWEYVPDSGVLAGPGTGGPVQPVIEPDGTLTFSNLGQLEPTESLTVTFRAIPTSDVVTDPGVGSGVAHVNTANANAVDATGAPGNLDGPYTSGDTTADAFIDSADLQIVKSHSDDPVAGEDFDWTLTVTNNGADPAVGPFTVTDTVQDPTTYVAASGNGWDCSAVGQDVTCTRTDANEVLDAGDSFPDITLTVAVPDDLTDGTVLTNTATVTDRTYDPDPSNNTDDDTASVSTLADLEIIKQLSGEPVAGQNATYTLSVVNHGPSVARADIVVTDTLPAGTTFVSADGPGWNCSEAGVVTCVLPEDLAVGEVAPQIELVLSVPSSQTEDLENTAEVESTTTPDPDPANNVDVTVDPVTLIADLALDKVSVGPLVAGEQGTYRFQVDNVGPTDAAAVVQITDTLPAGLTYVSASDVQGTWSCSAAGQDLTCDLSGGLVSGDTAIVEVTFDIDSGVLGVIDNTATVMTPTPETNLENNTDDDSSDFTAEVDLAIDKAHTEDAVAGEEFDWTITVTNNGPSDSPGPIQVSDGLPPGTSYVSASGAGWTCQEAAGTVTCSRPGGLTSGEVAPTITLTVLVSPDAGPAEIVNTASVTGPNPDTDPSNNSDDDLIDVADLVNLSLTKSTSGPNPVRAGEQTEFVIDVTNAGPSTADVVTVADRLPDGLTVADVSGDGWTCTTPSEVTIVCLRPTLQPGTTAPPIVITVDVASGVPDGSTLTNQAGVTTSSPEPDTTDNTDTADVDVVAEADLAVTKSHDDTGDPALAGEQVVFDLAVTNNGPSDAQPPITVTDTLPDGFSFVSSTGPWICTPAGQTVTCVLDGDAPLPAQTEAPALTIRTQLAPDVSPGNYQNLAEVTSPTTDPDPSNNSDTDSVPVASLVDLSIEKTHDGSVHVGEDTTFTLEVANAGPSTARGVVVTDSIPAGLEYVSATGPRWTCQEAGGDVQCDLTGPIGPQASAPPIEVTVTVLPGAYPQVQNVAEVASNTPEENLDDNTDDDTLVVPPLVDLAIAKSHDDPVKVGEQLVYSVEVTNNGPTADPGPITVVDALPDGVTFSSAAGPDWQCEPLAAQPQSVECVYDAVLAVDESTTVELTVDVEADAYPEIVNTAVVSTPSEETTLDNNEASDPAVVIPLVRLLLEKSVASQSDDQVLWDVDVTNLGPNDSVEAIIVTDPRVPGIEHVSAVGPGWDCTIQSNGDVVCTYPESVPVGETVSFTVTSDITAGPDSEITNVVISEGGQGVKFCPDDTGEDCSNRGEASASITTPPLSPPTDPDDPLPLTGARIGLLVMAGLMLIGAGLATSVYARRSTSLLN